MTGASLSPISGSIILYIYKYTNIHIFSLVYQVLNHKGPKIVVKKASNSCYYREGVVPLLNASLYFVTNQFSENFAPTYPF